MHGILPTISPHPWQLWSSECNVYDLDRRPLWIFQICFQASDHGFVMGLPELTVILQAAYEENGGNCLT